MKCFFMQNIRWPNSFVIIPKLFIISVKNEILFIAINDLSFYFMCIIFFRNSNIQAHLFHLYPIVQVTVALKMALPLWVLCLFGFLLTVVFVVLLGFGTTEMCGLTEKLFPEKKYPEYQQDVRHDDNRLNSSFA